MSVEAPPQPRSSTRSSPNVPPIDLRHMTSATVLAPLAPGDNRRASQHLQPNARKGSRSPSSIPSSPTSVHSSSSAIFERDIEPVLHLSSPSALPNATSPARPKDPHRTARSKNTEALEQSVPSVLDSAAAVLASLGPSLEDGDAVAVTAPAPHPASSASALFGDGLGLGGGSGTVRSRSTGTGSGFVSPIGSFRSRSPSPSPRSGGAGGGAGNRNSLLLNIPSPVGAPTPVTSPASAPASAPPTARQFDTAAPPDAAAPHATPRTPAASVNKRLSFVSYADLLSSTPTATQPLSALTSPAGSPAHIPGVDPAFAAPASASAGGSGAPSLRNFIFGAGAGAGGEDDRMMDDVGGEWEREGLGRGLEERLEALAGIGMS